MECIRQADYIFLEWYTSRLTGTTVERLQEVYQKEICLVDRREIEQTPQEMLDLAKTARVVLLSGGDPMVSTTHIDLRMRAESAGIETRIIHGASIATAISGVTGLQNYRFGKSCSV
ncbi:MAG TPA: diphthine synthase, partial [Methanomicrobiales archaeon]|nr:diphthine synthase [Methanomicrobiales archaeon]